MAPSSMVTIRVEELLHFFDEKPDWSHGHATSIVGVVGEDMNTACFQHYLESTGASARVFSVPNSDTPLPVTTGKRKGPRLDRWIGVNWLDGRSTAFQTEIKNWSAHAIGGKSLLVTAGRDEVADYKQKRWERHWNERLSTLQSPLTAKVLVRMKPPDGVDENKIRPLLMFWEAIGPKEQCDKHLFSVEACKSRFPFRKPDSWTEFCKASELWVFSVSSYLRSILEPTLDLSMPVGVSRLKILNDLFDLD